MIYLIILLILIQVLPSLLSASLHTHPTYREYGVRYIVDKPALVISVGKLMIRVEIRK